MKRLFPILILTFLLASCQKETSSWTLVSPGSGISVTISLSDQGKLTYQVIDAKNQQAITDPSSLGIIREDGRFVENLEFVGLNEESGLGERYTLLTGKKLVYEPHWNALSLSFKNLENQVMELQLRASEQGIAFRYHFPGESEKSVRVVEELTAFDFMDGNFWSQAYDTVSQWTPAYETYFEGPMPVGTNGPWNKNGWSFPFLVESQDHWILVSETGFDGSYGGSHIDANCQDGNYRIRFAEPGEAEGYYAHTSASSLPWTLPWRYLVIGHSLAAAVETSFPTDLAAPCALEDTTWIRPGRSTWSWWSNEESPLDYNLLLPFVDMAADMGWEYSLVDANWNHMKNGDLEKLAAYAETKNVGLLVWYNSGGKHNIVTEEPRDRMDRRKVRRAEFERISQMGIRGIKVDFFQSDKQEIIGQYIDILEDASDFGLVVNFHGCTLPKGWRRTYPNLLTMEAVRGGECYRFDANYPAKAPSHLSILPFTRNAVGPCDYTPGGFTFNTYPHKSTFGFEMALPVIIESGIMHFMDTPEQTLGLPDYAVDFLKKIPVCWDDTRYIAGYPGKDVVIARRSGERWYIGGINGEPHAKQLTIDLSDLGDAPSRLVLITDGASATELTINEMNPAEGKLSINMEPFGGFVGAW